VAAALVGAGAAELVVLLPEPDNITGAPPNFFGSAMIFAAQSGPQTLIFLPLGTWKSLNVVDCLPQTAQTPLENVGFGGPAFTLFSDAFLHPVDPRSNTPRIAASNHEISRIDTPFTSNQ